MFTHSAPWLFRIVFGLASMRKQPNARNSATGRGGTPSRQDQTHTALRRDGLAGEVRSAEFG